MELKALVMEAKDYKKRREEHVKFVFTHIASILKQNFYAEVKARNPLLNSYNDENGEKIGLVEARDKYKLTHTLEILFYKYYFA